MSQQVQFVEFGLSSFRGILVIALMAAMVFPAGTAAAQDTIEGALWSFTMKPKARGLQTVKGQFRVFRNQLFQKSKPGEKTFDKQVGTNNPNRDKTVIKFTDLRAIDKSRTWHQNIQGTARLKVQKFGFWTGTFIDSDGRHWPFECTRVQE